MSSKPRIFGRKGSPDGDGMDSAYVKLREMAMTTPPEALGLAAGNAERVWGVITDFWIGDGLVTLVCFEEGSTSLYFSTGGGIIGAGEHEGPRKASGELLRLGTSFLPGSVSVEETVPPPKGTHYFYLRTFGGLRRLEAEDISLQQGLTALSALFAAMQAVITQLRLVQGR